MSHDTPLFVSHTLLQVELFQRRCRGLANSISYNIALAIFGGLVRQQQQRQQQHSVHSVTLQQVPLMCTALVNKFDSLHSVCVLQV
jgi:hypothetical protein